MGIVYVECCESKHHCCCDCCDDWWDRCPNPVRRNESIACGGLRQALAARGSVDVPIANLTFIFTNQAVRYNSSYCPTLETGYRTPTVAELQSIATSMTSAQIGGTSLCPMLVWALNGVEPVLVEVVPATGSVQVLRTPSLRCRAYRVCVTTYVAPNG